MTSTTMKTNHYFRTLVALALLVGLLAVLAVRPAYASTTFTVNIPGDTNDADTLDNLCDVNLFGPGEQCTLRAAIQQSNATPGADTIHFDIPDSFGAGVKTIHVGATSPSNGALPVIKGAVTIDGYTQRPCSSNPAPCSRPNTLIKGTNAKPMIELDGSATPSGSAGLSIATSDAVVKGLTINRFTVGIETLSGATDTRIEGNFVGTDPSGTQFSGNITGVSLINTQAVGNNTVGGPDPADRNLISGNYFGVHLAANDSAVYGNLIGTQRDGKSPLPNESDGVSVYGVDNVVGGTAPGQANIVAFNYGQGIAVEAPLINPDESARNSILSNSVFSNYSIGIDLGDDGATPNDAGDADVGANHLQNKPVLSSAKKGADKTTVKGKLNSSPSRSYKLQFFSNPSGTNEGKKLLGSKSVSTDGSGNVSFSFATTKKVALRQNITATATRNATGDTSEFSAPEKVVAS